MRHSGVGAVSGDICHLTCYALEVGVSDPNGGVVRHTQMSLAHADVLRPAMRYVGDRRESSFCRTRCPGHVYKGFASIS